MKIVSLETYHVSPRWLFVRILTDAGVDGWGEPVVEGQAQSVQTLVGELGEFLVGQDPRRVEHLWQVMVRGSYYRGGPHLMSAISGIEQALWDITGKALGVPVYELFGGAVRDRVRVYAHATDGDSPGSPERAVELVGQGFDAIKLGVSAPLPPLPSPAVLDREAERVLAVRDAVGGEVDVAIDFHGRLSPEGSIALIERIKGADLMFIEEPVLPGNVDALVHVQRATGAVLATGERLFTRWGFREVIDRRAVAVLQPDLSHAGGISETRRIAASAEVSYLTVAPHNPLGPISLAAGLQLATMTPNFLIQEHPTRSDRSDLGVGLLREPFEIVNGHIDRPLGAGLGIDVDLDAVRARQYPGDWRTPQLRHGDGSVADW